MCFHVWRLTTRVIDDDVVVVTNGNLRSAESEDGGSTCILPFKHYTDEDYYHACHKTSEDSSPYSSESSREKSQTALWLVDIESISSDQEAVIVFFLRPFSRAGVDPPAWQVGVAAVRPPQQRHAATLQPTVPAGQPHVAGRSRHSRQRGSGPSNNTKVPL